MWFFPYLMSSVAIAFLFTYALATNGGIFSELASLIAGKNVTVDLLDVTLRRCTPSSA